MAEEAVVPGYEVGKELGWSTPQLLGAGMSYGVALLFSIPAVNTLSSMAGLHFSGKSTENPTAAFIGLGVFLALGIWATISHRRSPLSRCTVVKTVRNCDGLYSAELRFLDGSTINHNLGLVLPLSKQFMGFAKALATGK